MAAYLGDFTTANTVYIYFNTFDSENPSASVTLTGLAVGDIFIYKNGSTTERSSTAGFTLLDTDGIDFDAKTGIHGFSIDLSDNTDSGFYAAGGEYTVVVASVTVDAATVNFVAAHFSIERTGGALALLKGTNSLANIEDKIDTLTTNVATVDTVVDGIQTDLSNSTDGLGALKTLIDTLDGVVDTILVDTNELQTDWANGGRLDLILDARASQTSVDDLPTNAELATALGTADDATLAQIALVKAKTDLIPAAPAAVGDIPTATENADALLNRDMSAVSDTTARSPLNALRFLRNKYGVVGTTLTICKEDDLAVAWTSTVTSDAAAEPITGSDPA